MRFISLKDRGRVRPFYWRDLRWVRRLQSQGQVLDYERALVDGLHPLREALWAYLLLGARGPRTMVASCAPGRSAFVQFHYQSEERVRLSYLAPAPSDEAAVECWVGLLEGLTAAVGGPGAFHFLAEARQDGPEMETLQRAGFSVFARQELFRLDRLREPLPLPDESPELRPWRPSDNWAMRLLYTNTVPHLVQRIEPPTVVGERRSPWRRGFVLEEGAELLAFAAVRRGRRGNALHFLLHPEADVYAEPLIRQGLTALAETLNRPTYCWVRRYQGCLWEPLERVGFERVGQMALLVKHTVVRVASPAWKPVPVAESRAKMTTPLILEQER